jgi:ABC-type transport system involved in multi-copper enzyme maturation permease subunit
MNLPATLFLLGWLIRETFRQALAARTFWLMLSVSTVCILFCLSVHIEGEQSLNRPDEIELVGPDNQPLTGPNPNLGHLELAFGAVRLPLFRNAEAQVRFLQTLLAFWVAGVVGTLVTLVWTAGFLPAFLEPSAAAVLLAKPVPRSVLLTGKCLGVLTFVAFQEAAFFFGTWLALGLRTGVWPAQYLWCVPLLLLQFMVIYSFSALMAVCTRSTAAAIFGAVLFWFCCYAMNYGRHAVVALPYLEAGPAPFSARLQEMVEAGYWVLPKPGDLVILLDGALQAGDHFDVLPRAFRVAQEHGAFTPDLSVLASLLFSAGLMGVACWQFRTTDY